MSRRRKQHAETSRNVREHSISCELVLMVASGALAIVSTVLSQLSVIFVVCRWCLVFKFSIFPCVFFSDMCFGVIAAT